MIQIIQRYIDYQIELHDTWEFRQLKIQTLLLFLGYAELLQNQPWNEFYVFLFPPSQNMIFAGIKVRDDSKWGMVVIGWDEEVGWEIKWESCDWLRSGSREKLLYFGMKGVFNKTIRVYMWITLILTGK